MQVPSNAVMNHVGKPSLYLGFFTCAWGLVSLLTSQVKSFGGMVACRFILGIVEAPFFAGVLFYLSKWYTKSELNLRMSIFYSASMLSGAFGPLIAAGILSSKTLIGYHGINAWQWVRIQGSHHEWSLFFQMLTLSVISCTSSRVLLQFWSESL
jgi:MFS family permease